MKYVKNNLGFSVKFKAGTGTGERAYSFDCYRVFSDTGNVATDGITAIEDADYAFLCKECAQFKKMIERGDLTLTAKAMNAAQDKAKALEDENKKLKKQLAEAAASAANNTGEKASVKEKKLAEENKSLKEQLEALKKESADLKAAIEKSAGQDAEATGF